MKVKIVAISDTHLRHYIMKHPVPDGDILIIAGDATVYGKLEEFEDFNNWLLKLPHRYKVMIGGNHDCGLDIGMHPTGETVKQCQEALTGITHYLNNSGVRLYGIKFWGVPETPEFFNWAFNVPRNEMDRVWKKVPKDTQVLISHGPPHRYGDLAKCIHTSKLIPVGCKSQRDLVEDKERLPKLEAVVCGHIHSGYGQYGIAGRKDCYVYNVSTCNENYHPVNKPVVFELAGRKSAKEIREELRWPELTEDEKDANLDRNMESIYIGQSVGRSTSKGYEGILNAFQTLKDMDKDMEE